MTKLAVVILNWNGRKLLEQFMPSVVKYSMLPNCELVVADNGSTDDSLDFLSKYYPEVRQISLPLNYGFAGGYNEALKQLDAEYFLLLNSDVEVTEAWLLPLLQHMDENKDVAACMPKIRSYHSKQSFEYAGAAGGFIDSYGYLFCRGRVLNVIEEDRGQYDSVTDIFWATGACMLIRSAVFIKAGGFDSDFFAHMEEVDLCWRIKQQGYRISCVPQSVVYHLGGGTLSYSNPRKLYLNHRNSLYMLYKNLPSKGLRRRIAARLLLDGVSGCLYLLSGKPKSFLAVLKAHRDFYRCFGTLKKKRWQVKANATIDRVDPVYRSLLVWKFFVSKKKTYADLVTPK